MSFFRLLPAGLRVSEDALDLGQQSERHLSLSPQLGAASAAVLGPGAPPLLNMELDRRPVVDGGIELEQQEEIGTVGHGKNPSPEPSVSPWSRGAWCSPRSSP